MASEGHLTAVAYGEVEVEGGVLVLRRIHVVFVLKGAAEEKIDAANRAHEVFKAKCPVYRSHLPGHRHHHGESMIEALCLVYDRPFICNENEQSTKRIK